jgi:hypothetical protein
MSITLAPITFAISSGTADSAKDTDNKVAAKGLVEAFQNEDASGPTKIQGPVKKWNERSQSSATIRASPNNAPAS